jgi:hypothetical protein
VVDEMSLREEALNAGLGSILRIHDVKRKALIQQTAGMPFYLCFHHGSWWPCALACK